MNLETLCGERLLACVAMVRDGAVVADIGTDHAYLACYLVESGRCPRALATDLNDAPLGRARDQVARCGLEDRVELRLTDGLQGLPLARIDDVVIAGMGGELIADILRGEAAARDGRLRFVLQPMSRPEALRRALCEDGFELLEEHGVCAGEFVYTVMRVRYTGQPTAPDELFVWTGLLPENDDPDSAEMLRATLRRVLQRAQGMRRSVRDRAEAGRWEALAAQIAQILDNFDRED